MAPSAHHGANDTLNGAVSLATALVGLKSALAHVNCAIGLIEASDERLLPLLADTDDEDVVLTIDDSPVVIPSSLGAADVVVQYDNVAQSTVDLATTPASASNAEDSDPVFHVPTPAEDRWYAVIIGRKPGVFMGPQSSNTTGVSGGLAVRCKSEALAKAFFDEQLEAGVVERVEEVIVKRTIITRDMLPAGTYSLSK